jgi:hypothetical protein
MSFITIYSKSQGHAASVKIQKQIPNLAYSNLFSIYYIKHKLIKI